MMVKTVMVNRIRQLSKQGKSSNEIVRQLRREGIGIRRKTILTYAREFKGRPPKPHAEKYVPRKYRRTIAPRPAPKEKQKHIAVYGSHRGKSKRYQLSGTGRNLYRFLIDAVEHPPKQQFLRVSVNEVRGLSDRAKYIDYKGFWDEKPTIKS